MTTSPAPQTLYDFTHQDSDSIDLEITGITQAPRSLKTRLLEIGLVKGTHIIARRQGSHIALKVRGDHLILRRSEAHILTVRHLTSGEGLL